MKGLLVLILTVAACAGTAAPTEAPSVATPTATPTPAATSTAPPAPVPTPSPTEGINPDTVRHVVADLDTLAGLVASGASGDDVARWGQTATQFLLAHDKELPRTQAIALLQAFLDLSQAVVDGVDLTPSVNALLAFRDDLAALVGGVATPEPTAAANQFQPGEVVKVTSGGADWANVTVSKVKVVTRYRGSYTSDVPAKGNVFIQVFVTYQALVDGVDYNPYDWQVYVAGTAIDRGGALLFSGPSPALHSGTLPKGRKAAGWIVYEVAAKGQVLMSYGTSSDVPVFEVVLRAK